ncbi:nuclear transport factor 2 family protein [Rhodococcus aetherivorans]|uniref:nuclear transport factor 2 family protein n=1 Tax=Rhodococcus sp. YH1 TaxID=89066 RepID=UPI0013871C1A|nr:hypothetical protein [Rhodococcus sp. YH1]
MTAVSPDLARRAEDVMYAYATAVDEGDLDALRALITEDVSITQNGKEDAGPEEFLGVYRAFAESGAEFSRHAITNVRVSDEGGGRVRVDAYFEATVAGPEGTQRLYGRYADTFAEREGTLLIERKRITVDRVLDQPASAAAYAPY